MIGASKSSTTAMYKLLQRHPQVWLPLEKGAYYFTADDYERPEAWNAYLKLFAAAPSDARIVGESSNTYTRLPESEGVAERMADRLGQPKLLYMVRDPVARAASHFRHRALDGGRRYASTFTEALERDPGLVAVSQYARQLESFDRVFGRDAVHVVVAERLHTEPIQVLREVEAYLGLDPYDWQPEDLPRTNTFADLQKTTGWRKIIGARGYRLARRVVPDGLRRRLKNMGPSAPAPPEVTDADRARVLDAVADDLRCFRERMGAQIDRWLSVQRLGLAAAPGAAK